eukprot:4395890-Amphidinium_carterae.2
MLLAGPQGVGSTLGTGVVHPKDIRAPPIFVAGSKQCVQVEPRTYHDASDSVKHLMVVASSTAAQPELEQGQMASLQCDARAGACLVRSVQPLIPVSCVPAAIATGMTLPKPGPMCQHCWRSTVAPRPKAYDATHSQRRVPASLRALTRNTGSTMHNCIRATLVIAWKGMQVIVHSKTYGHSLHKSGSSITRSHLRSMSQLPVLCMRR